jgi:4'-phosphopantetheinyl transferase
MSAPTPLPDAASAHLWLFLFVPPPDPATLAAAARLMSEDEATQHARYLVDRARDEYALTRLLVRSVLSRYAPVAPAAWTFARSEHGRPEVSGPEGAPRLRFNLSNTQGLIACLVRAQGEVGVDAEDLKRRGETVEIAERFFAPAEVRALRALPASRQRLRFFEYWTLKEAYMKARGLGLTIPLDAFAFDLGAGPPIRIAFDGIADDPRAWQFGLARPSKRHILAWAIRRPAGGPPVRVETFAFDGAPGTL